MKRSLALRIVLGVVAAIVLLVVALALFDWNRAKPWLNGRISESVDRPFAINGDLSLQWQRGDAHLSGWRSWLPWPHLVAKDIRLGNPADIEAQQPFAQVAQLRFSLNPLALVTRDIVIPAIYLDQARFNLIRTAEERNNWTFGSGGESAWDVHVGDVQLHRGSIHLNDVVQQIEAMVNVDTIPPEQDAAFRTRWTVEGVLQQQKLSGKGRAGALLALREQHAPFPLQATLKAGDTALAVDGSVTGIPSFTDANLQLQLSGNSMAHLHPLIGVLLPHTPEFSTQGRLQKAGSTWHYRDFSGRVGKSDLSGSLTVELEGERPRLMGELVSKQLRLRDLGPLAGSGDKENMAKGDESPQQPDDKVLPVREFDTEKWKTLDADVRFRGKRIVRNNDSPFEDMVTHLKLEEGVLTLSPLTFGVAGGKLNSDVRLDGSRKTIRAAVDVTARGMKLSELFPGVEKMEASIGEMNADAKLTSRGNSVSEMLGHANGEIKALVSEGRVSKLLLEQIGLNIGSIVVTKLFGDEQVKLHCMAANLEVKEGVVRTQGFIVDTEQAIIRARGVVYLEKETMDIAIHPENKRIRLLSLRSPIYVQGNFDDPDIGVDKSSIATQAGGALALGLAAPVAAALLPLINPGEEEKDNSCYRLLQQAQVEPQAPPAEKSSK
jgi:uncharacterized protein involved in outer membrane biogenesis